MVKGRGQERPGTGIRLPGIFRIKVYPTERG